MAVPAVVVKSSTAREDPCKGLSEVSVWPCHACTYLASFTWALMCWAVFSDISPALTKKNSYSWPSNSDFALIDAPAWIQGGSAPASQIRIQQHPFCSSALTFTEWCFGQPSAVHPFSAHSSLYLSHLHKHRYLPLLNLITDCCCFVQ